MELIKIDCMKTNNGEVDSVSAKELYLFLGLNKSHFKRWADLNIEDNEFATEYEDYIGFALKANGNQTRDFAISIPFAKKLSMLTRTKKGEEIREYFLKCEKVVLEKQQLEIPQSFADALLLAGKLEKEKEQALLLIEEQKPLVNLAESIQASKDCISFQKMANIHFKFGRNTLFKHMRDFGILNSNNDPYRKYIDQGFFEVDEKNINNRLISTTFITSKGQLWIMNNWKMWIKTGGVYRPAKVVSKKI